MGNYSYFDSYVDLLVPLGKIAIIDDIKSLDVTKMKSKRLASHLEFMFARSMYKSTDMKVEGQLLSRVADLIDQGYVEITVGKNLGRINANNLKTAHQLLESGKSIRKIVLEGL